MRLAKRHKTSNKNHKHEHSMQTKLSHKNITENLNRKGVRVKQWCVKKSPKKKGALKKRKTLPATELSLH